MFVGTPWVRKHVGLGRISAYWSGRGKTNKLFFFSSLFFRHRSQKFAEMRVQTLPKLSVEGSIPFARSNDFNDLD
jgi:hypothetical protein